MQKNIVKTIIYKAIKTLENPDKYFFTFYDLMDIKSKNKNVGAEYFIDKNASNLIHNYENKLKEIIEENNNENNDQYEQFYNLMNLSKKNSILYFQTFLSRYEKESNSDEKIISSCKNVINYFSKYNIKNSEYDSTVLQNFHNALLDKSKKKNSTINYEQLSQFYNIMIQKSSSIHDYMNKDNQSILNALDEIWNSTEIKDKIIELENSSNEIYYNLITNYFDNFSNTKIKNTKSRMAKAMKSIIQISDIPDIENFMKKYPFSKENLLKLGLTKEFQRLMNNKLSEFSEYLFQKMKEKVSFLYDKAPKISMTRNEIDFPNEEKFKDLYKQKYVKMKLLQTISNNENDSKIQIKSSAKNNLVEKRSVGDILLSLYKKYSNKEIDKETKQYIKEFFQTHKSADRMLQEKILSSNVSVYNRCDT